MSNGELNTQRRGGVLVLTFSLSPQAVFGVDLCHQITKELDMAEKEVGLHSVVIAATGRHFTSAIDVSGPTPTAIEKHPSAPRHNTQNRAALAQLCHRIEGLSKPVIVAMQGRVFGPGFALALAAHHRIATPDARFAMPAVSFDLLPDAGAAIRLPRLVGAEHAISILIDAKVLTAVEALSIGLIDEVVENDPQSAALKRAEIGLAPIGVAHIAPGLRDPRRYFAATTSARQKYAQSRLVTPTHIVDCIDAALVLTSLQAFDLEAATADMLQSKAQSMALRYAYASEKKSVLPPDTIRAQPTPPLSVVIIWGADETAVDIAVQMLAVGLQVQIVDQNREALAVVLSLIAKRQLASVNAGRMSIDAQQADWLRLTTSQSTATVQAADIVLVTQGAGPVPSFVTPARIIVLGSLDKGASGSALSIVPVPSQGLTTEIGMGSAVGLTKLGLAYALLKRLKWQAVLVGQGGSVQARLQTCFAACTKSLEQRGHAATDISAALASFGIGAALRGPVTPMPDQGAKIISAFCLAMANEGLRLIQEGIAKRPTDVDVLAVASGLYPRWQGGPMYWARALGLFGLRAQLRAQASLSGATEASLFTPVDLLDLWIRQDVSLPLMDDQPG